MDHLTVLIHELHRRALWQVLGIYLAASWGVLQVVEVLTEAAGLPDWTPSMALILLLLGLPVVLATAFVQEGLPGQEDGGEPVPWPGPDGQGVAPDHEGQGASPGDDGPTGSGDAGRAEAKSFDAGAPVNLAAGTGSLDRPTTRPSTTRRLFTWKHALGGGAAAFLLLIAAVATYLIMWSTGIGPVGNLVAQGVIEEGDQVILADFEDRTGEGLGAVVTEALRVDLAQSAVIDFVEPAELAPVLGMMQVETGSPLTSDRALEVAVRAGYPAVLEGAVAAAGTGYVVTATLREADTGRSVATFRASADDASDVIATIDELSQDIREKSGESLRTIRAGQPLETVTTASLEALRLYSEARSIFSSEPATALELLDRAVEIDPGFAMAWRTIGAIHFNLASAPQDLIEAATRAYENRHRLTERERYLTEAFYHQSVDWDMYRAIDAYRNVLRLDPDDGAALNNLGIAYSVVGEHEASTDTWVRAMEGEGASATALLNLVTIELRFGDVETAATYLARWEESFPEASDLTEARFLVALFSGAHERARDIATTRLQDATLSPVERSEAAFWLAKLEYRRGRFSEARDRIDESVRGVAQMAPPLAGMRSMYGLRAEALLGNPARAAATVEAALEDGSYERTLGTSGFDGLVATIVAYAGEPDLVERVRTRWVAAGELGGQTPLGEAAFTRAAIVARAATGDTVGVVEEMELFVQGLPCNNDTCWVLERAFVTAAAGHTDAAIRRYERVGNVDEFFFDLLGITDVHADLRLGPLYEEAGDTARAADAYRRIIGLWSDGDAEARRVVEAFRVRLEALGAAQRP